jgi:hypothetical protein
VELGTRNIKVALRKPAAASPARVPRSELDLPDTIRSTASNAGWLDVKMVPERHNAVKVLICSSMSAARWTSMCRSARSCSRRCGSEFKHYRAFLLPQLRLRDGVEGQSPPLVGEDADLAEVLQYLWRATIKPGLRRRRDHEPLRDFS